MPDVTFTEGERAALRDIITNWIDEELVTAPYTPELASAIKKLGIPERAVAAPPGLPVV